MGFFIQLTIFLFLISLGLIVGRSREKKHFANLDVREQATAHILVTQLKSFPDAGVQETPPMMLTGQTVIATDYLKSFLAGLRNFFGGRVGSFQTMLTRARREALQQIVDEAQNRGYNAVCNVRFDKADVGGSTASKKAAAMVAILASGTAYHADLD